MVKLLMTWDIKKNKEPAYFEFIMKEFSPGLAKLGLQPSEAWYTVYGPGPQILTGGIAEDLPKMREILKNSEWHELKAQLLNYVTNFHEKVIPATGRFQL
jgi:hypothetical protein